MCRLLGYVADRPVTFDEVVGQGLQSFIDLSWLHKDGWGIAWRDVQATTRLVKRPEQALVSETISRRLRQVCGPAAIFHLRWSTGGRRVVENTHPFFAGGMAFAHNGSVDDAEAIASWIDPQLLDRRSGSTDSELLFLAFLSSLRRGLGTVDAMRETLAAVHAHHVYSALNFLLLTPECLLAGCAFDPSTEILREQPRYFDLSYRAREGSVVVASSGWDPADSWSPLGNGTMLHVDLRTLRAVRMDML